MVVLCPGCRAVLAASGTLSIGDRKLGVYQCDRCVRTVRFGGEDFLAALTFALDPDGNLLDPVTADRIDPATVRAGTADELDDPRDDP